MLKFLYEIKDLLAAIIGILALIFGLMFLAMKGINNANETGYKKMIEADQREWTIISRADSDSSLANFVRETAYKPIPGGRLYRETLWTGGHPSVALTFVPTTAIVCSGVEKQ